VAPNQMATDKTIGDSVESMISGILRCHKLRETGRTPVHFDHSWTDLKQRRTELRSEMDANPLGRKVCPPVKRPQEWLGFNLEPCRQLSQITLFERRSPTFSLERRSLVPLTLIRGTFSRWQFCRVWTGEPERPDSPSLSARR
jgi:hypothetical protein